jgi:hypothetical protein
MTEELVRMIALVARGIVMRPGEAEEQRRSWAYGNCAIGKPDITREMIDEVAERMAGR